MEKIVTPEGLVRRTLIKEDGRFLHFYNPPGEEQPIDPDAESAQSHGDPATAIPFIQAKDNTHV